VQASWVTQGLKVLEVGLHFGGNDVGSVMLEENVVRAAGTSNCTTEEELRRIIRDAGFMPVQRDTLYPHDVLELKTVRRYEFCWTTSQNHHRVQTPDSFSSSHIRLENV